jgi:hypothetical protein
MKGQCCIVRPVRMPEHGHGDGRLIRWRSLAGRMLGEPAARWDARGEFAATRHTGSGRTRGRPRQVPGADLRAERNMERPVKHGRAQLLTPVIAHAVRDRVDIAVTFHVRAGIDQHQAKDRGRPGARHLQGDGPAGGVPAQQNRPPQRWTIWRTTRSATAGMSYGPGWVSQENGSTMTWPASARRSGPNTAGDHIVPGGATMTVSAFMRCPQRPPDRTSISATKPEKYSP